MVVAQAPLMKAGETLQRRRLQFENQTETLARSPVGKKMFRCFEYRKTGPKGNAARSPD
jgi:hypothetical protein